MAKTDFKSIDEYIQTFPPDVRENLEAIRSAIQDAVPEAEEVISYQIPALKFHGWVFYFSAYAKHYSLSCPPPFSVFTAFEEELRPYAQSKSTVQFPKNKPIPLELIGAMAKYRARENLGKTNARKN
ncbi:DUF1801 domain-containing protein [Aquamicrobium sp. LC103]|uniref:iron chaperone n=1 Tax=Aquamicrobium sp. LC103 TaxID=1120658 RepID=UPI00063EAFAA|nr:DUF1801 domain-containing protein [Aquamicrobium sp. LC103]TKT81083.1 DUF1801 domain-containing protein [Aquamicrobium sp. LC103]